MARQVGTRVDYVQKETRIALIGKTGSGKSSTGNTLLNKGWFEAKLSNISITKKTSSKHGKYNQQHMLVIDTPGLFDTEVSNTVMRKEIMKCVALAAPGLHAVVLVTKIGRFTEEEKKTVQEYKKYFGEDLCRYLLIIFTGKGDLDADGMSLGQYLQHADPVLQELMRECGHRYLAVNNKGSQLEKTEFRKLFFSLLEDTVRRAGGRCYTSGMLEEAEVQMKLAERRKMTELVDQRGRMKEEEQKSIEYEEKLERKARKLARKDVEDETTLDNFMTKLIKKFKHLG